MTKKISVKLTVQPVRLLGRKSSSGIPRAGTKRARDSATQPQPRKQRAFTDQAAHQLHDAAPEDAEAFADMASPAEHELPAQQAAQDRLDQQDFYNEYLSHLNAFRADSLLGVAADENGVTCVAVASATAGRTSLILQASCFIWYVNLACTSYQPCIVCRIASLSMSFVSLCCSRPQTLCWRQDMLCTSALVRGWKPLYRT